MNYIVDLRYLEHLRHFTAINEYTVPVFEDPLYDPPIVFVNLLTEGNRKLVGDIVPNDEPLPFRLLFKEHKYNHVSSLRFFNIHAGLVCEIKDL